MSLSHIERAAVIQEARTWLHTPWHHMARIKGAGVDCGMLLLEVYERAGIIPHVDPPPYPHDWHMHRSEEKYLAIVEQFCDLVPVAQPADIVTFHWGRCVSHAAIVIAWPLIIHAYVGRGVILDDAQNNTVLSDRLAGIYEVTRGRG